jgi:transcriptional regulator with XRE-family HTH domain
MDVSAPYSPDHIRLLRGDLSRAEFARRCGVTPLTVYRWELPEGAAEARRPRGQVLERLKRSLGADVLAPRPEPRPVAAMPDAEADLLAVALRRLGVADWRGAEDALIRALATGLRTPGARARAAVELARIQHLVHGDVRGAFATIVPFLGEASTLPPDVEAHVHIVAALVFAQADGRMLDPGRVNMHAARAEALLGDRMSPEAALMLHAARVAGAFHLGDIALFRREVAAFAPHAETPVEPLLEPASLELRGLAAFFSGRASVSATLHRAAASRAADLGLALWEARSLAFAALRELDDAHAPEEALALARRSREVAASARLGDGLYCTIGGKAEAEALTRLARFDEAERSLMEIERVCDALAWTPGAFGLQLARVYALTGRPDAMRALGERLARWDGVVQRDVTRLTGELIRAWADLASGRGAHVAIGALEQVFQRLDSDRPWPILERDALILLLTANVAAGRLDAARATLRRLDQYLDRLPSAWVIGVKRRLEGMLLCAEGRLVEGTQLIEGGLAAAILTGDVTEAMLSRRLLAQVAGPDGEGKLAASDAEISAAGMSLPSRLSVPDQPLRACAPASGLDLVVPIERVALRGVPPALLHRELVHVVAGMFPGEAVSLEAIGGAAPIATSGSSESGRTWTEFADGAGGRLRIGVSGDRDDRDRAALRALVQVAALSLEIASLRGLGPDLTPPDDLDDQDPFVAASPAMRRLKAEIGRLGGSRATVILTGESGTGKEIVAEAIHARSVRAKGPFVAFNCATVPRDLFEGQLFGYRKGAFTGANADHPGVIRAADGGTVFLDEIGELPLDVQPKLLRFLENGEVFPLGDQRPVQVDVRVIAATHRDLAELVRQQKFRDDLYYRLQVVPIHILPLRERPEDVLVLARHFLRKYAPDAPPRIGPDAEAALLAHAWRGNVRELRNAIERALAYGEPPAVLTAEMLKLSR